MQHQGDYGKDEQQVNQSTGDVEYGESK